jgi:hypothetical protein
MFDRKTVIVLVILAVGILGILLWVNQLNKNRYNWNFTHDIESKEPYGGYAMYQMMKSYFPDKKFIRLDKNISESLPETTEAPSNYLFVGYSMYLDTARVERLQTFVEKGNNAYIFASFLPDDLMTSFFGHADCRDYNYSSHRNSIYKTYADTSIQLSLRHPNLKGKATYKKIANHETELGYWSIITWNNCDYVENHVEFFDEYEEEATFLEAPVEEAIDTSYDYEETEEVYEFEEVAEDTTAYYSQEEEAIYEEEEEFYDAEPTQASDQYLSLGNINGNDTLTNFVRIKYGDGYFYFYTTPIVFTNYYLSSPTTIPYVTGVLAHLQKGDIYWDNQSNMLSQPARIADVGSNNLMPPSSRASFNQQTPLQYILSERSFAWAWYLLLLTGVFYLFFRAKRKQRIIPVIAVNTNTSLEFVETIGMLHWQQNDHRQLAMQQMKLLGNYIKTRYNIPFNPPLDEALIEKLATVSELPKDHLIGLFRKYAKIEELETITEERLSEFHKSVDYFYKNCK